MVIEEDIGVRRTRAQLFGIEKMLDTGRRLKAAGADEGPEPGIEAVGTVAAFAQRVRLR